MTLEHFMNEAISSWMRKEGPESDIVLSTRIRLARNLADEPFPITASGKKLQEINDIFYERYNHSSIENYANLEFININQLSHIEKRVLVEKHLISPFLAKSKVAAVLISENEQASIMINEEDHIRIQLYFSGLQLKKALDEAFLIDDWLEETIDYAFDEEKGYLTSCPTNTGTGLRASVMLHLPALVYTKRISRMLPAINQLGFVVRGIYGEGSEARGSIFQISNQITLGKSEQDICKDLEGIITQLVGQERLARQNLLKQSQISLENEVFRSYGLLKYSRIMESSEAMNRLSHLRLGIDLGIITDISHNVLNELIVLIQPGFLQYYAKANLTANERDILRASLIRERLQIEV